MNKIAKKRKKLAVKTYYCLCEGLRYRIKKGLEKLKWRTAGFVLYFLRGRVKYRFGYSGGQSFPQIIMPCSFEHGINFYEFIFTSSIKGRIMGLR